MQKIYILYFFKKCNYKKKSLYIFLFSIFNQEHVKMPEAWARWETTESVTVNNASESQRSRQSICSQIIQFLSI